MSDFSSNRPIRNYYKESLNYRTKPAPCPVCGGPGHYAINWYEVGKRVPTVMAEGVATCSHCKRLAQTGDERLRGEKLWYCDYCSICLCAQCQKSPPKKA